LTNKALYGLYPVVDADCGRSINIKVIYMVKGIGHGVVEQIRALYHEDVSARAFFDWVAERQNDSAETSLDRMVQKLDLSRGDAVALAKQLEGAECCRFIVGRKGARSRLKWFYSLRSLGMAARGSADALEDVDPDIAAEVVDQTAAAADETSEQVVRDGVDHQYKLRLDTTVTFKLPGDLTKREAERLATFIQSLPFEA
jgi:hypothetical protein